VKERMLFVAVLTHTPESCLMRPEHAKAYEELIKNWENTKKLVKVLGGYVNPNEHTFFIILEADNYASVTRALGPPMLTYHTGKITPVITMDEAIKVLKT